MCLCHGGWASEMSGASSGEDVGAEEKKTPQRGGWAALECVGGFADSTYYRLNNSSGRPSPSSSSSPRLLFQK